MQICKNNDCNDYLIEQILIGSLLGDGCIYMNAGKYLTYSEGHSHKQKEYLLWKNNHLSFNFNGYYTNVNGYKYISINKTNNKRFKYLYYLFYFNGKKRVTKAILDKIDSLGLAVWYMDDGYYNYMGNCIDLYTCGFTLKENMLIQKWLSQKYNIDSKIYIKKEKYPYIFLNSSETKKFIKIIKSHIILSMKYKIGLDSKRNKKAKIKRNLDNLKPKRVAYRKQWVKDNKEKVNLYARIGYWKNVEKNSNRNRKYRIKNKERLQIYGRKYYSEHSDKIKKYGKEYHKKNRERILRKNRENYHNSHLLK